MEVLKMISLGRHLLINMSGCHKRKLNSLRTCIDILERGVDLAGATKIGTVSHEFDPKGVTVLVGLAESHISIHTWPETGEARADVYTCGEDMDPQKAADYILEQFGCRNAVILDVDRTSHNFQTNTRMFSKPRKRAQGSIASSKILDMTRKRPA